MAGTGHRVEFHGDDRLELGRDVLIRAYRCLYDYRDVLQAAGLRVAAEPVRRPKILVAADAEPTLGDRNLGLVML